MRPANYPISLLIPVVLLLSLSGVAQNRETKERYLKPGKVERQIASGEAHSYLVTLQRRQFLHVVANSSDIDLVVKFYGPSGKDLLTADLLKYPGPEPLSYEAVEPGEYRLEIRAEAAPIVHSRYNLRTVLKGTSDDKQAQRMTAERLLIEANRLQLGGSKESLQKAIDTRTQALTLWRGLGDRYWEAYTLHWIGSAASSFGQDTKALEWYNQALKLRRDIGDREGEITTLIDLGNLSYRLNDKQRAIGFYNEALPLFHAAADRLREGDTLVRLAIVHGELGEKEKGLDYYDQALPIYRAAGDQLREAAMLISLGIGYSTLNKKQKALDYYNQALPIYRALGQKFGEAVTLIGLGLVYRDLNENQKALDYFNQALPICRAIGDKSREAGTLNGIGNAYYALKENQKAFDYYSQALPIYRGLQDKSGEATTLAHLGDVYDDLGDKHKSMELFSQALPLMRATGDTSAEGGALIHLGNLAHDFGENQKALEFYNRALTLERAVGSKVNEALVLYNLANVYYGLGENEKAVDLYNQALTLQRAIGDKSSEASTLNNLGNVYSNLWQKQKALEIYNQALTLNRELGDKSGEADALYNLGLLYAVLGEKKKALDFFNQALPLKRAVGDTIGEANTINNMGIAYSDLGEKQKAVELYNQLLPFRRRVGDKRGEADTLANLAIAYATLGEQRKALEFLNQALPLEREIGDKHGEVGTLNNLGNIYSDLGQPQKALEFYQQALLLHRQMGDKSGEANALGSLGNLYSALGENQKALEFYKEALTRTRALGDKSGEAATLNNLGNVYSALGDNQKALESYNEALLLDRAEGDKSGEALNLGNLMLLWSKLKRPALAIFYGKQAINDYQQLRSNIKGLEKEIQLTYLHTIETRYRQLADLLISEGRLPEAQQVLGLLKEQEYFEFVRRDGNEASGGNAERTPEEASLEKRYNEIADRLTALASEYGQLRDKATRTTEEEQRLSLLASDLTTANQVFQKFLDNIDKEFSGTTGGRDKAFQLRESQGLMETLRDLDSGTVALYTVVGEDKYRVILVTPEVQKAYEYPIKAADLNRKVMEFREAIQNPRIDPRPLAEELFKILIGAELARDLEQTKAQTLMWSQDGALRYLPVAALYDGQHYLVERYRNVVFTPASQSRLKDTVSTKWKGLGFGVSKAHPGFGGLPGVTKELRGIIRDESAPAATTEGVLNGVVKLDEAFTADAMQVALRQHYPLVHIASHFSFKPGNETDSFLLLGDGSHLTLAQIKALPNVFSGVELLTLSACDTATGGVGASGKEVEGFGVLAQRQGAKAVMATLWPVADESTQLLMREFYSLRENNPRWNKAEALRQAQLELLRGSASTEVDPKSKRAEIVGDAAPDVASKQPGFMPDAKAPYAHPYYWAPFILIGNWK